MRSPTCNPIRFDYSILKASANAQYRRTECPNEPIIPFTAKRDCRGECHGTILTIVNGPRKFGRTITNSQIQFQNIQPALQAVHHVHCAVFVDLGVVDAVGVGAFEYPGDVVGDLLWLERVGGVEDGDAVVEEGGVTRVSGCGCRDPGRFWVCANWGRFLAARLRSGAAHPLPDLYNPSQSSRVLSWSSRGAQRRGDLVA